MTHSTQPINAVTCEDCTQARTTKHWYGYRAHCKGCQARAAARSPECFEAKQAGKLTPAYKDLLQAMGVSHEEVKAWA